MNLHEKMQRAQEISSGVIPEHLKGEDSPFTRPLPQPHPMMWPEFQPHPAYSKAYCESFGVRYND